MTAEELAFLMMEGRQEDMRPYAELLLEMRAALLRTEHEPMCDFWTRGPCDCSLPTVLAQAEALLA